MAVLLSDTDLSKRKLRVLYITSNLNTASFDYRIKYPSTILRRSGLIEARILHVQDSINFSEYSQWADVIVFQYPYPEIVIKLCDIIKEFKTPQITVMEFDDDILNTHPTNYGAYITFGIKELKGHYEDGKDGFNLKENMLRHDLFKKALGAVDLVTVTTEQLAKAYSPYCKNIINIHNYINPDVMPTNEKKNQDSRTVICYQGGDSHYADIMSVMPVLQKIKKQYKNTIHFKFFGSDFKKLYKSIDAEHVPWDNDDFYRTFSKHKIDIGIIPLINNQFNTRKSNIKWLEYSYYKIPSVVANMSPYKQHIDQLRTGYLYSTPEQMFLLLRDLIDDPIQRLMIGGMAKQEVDNKWTIQTNAVKWYKVFMTHLTQKIKLTYLQ